MRTIRPKSFLVAVMAAGLSTLAHAAPLAMTSKAMEALSAKQADAKAKQDLLSVLQPTHKFSRGMFRAVRGIDMKAVPHGTSMAGLCTMDDLIMWYGPTQAKPEPGDEPLRPTGFRLTHLYRAARDVGYLDDRYPIDPASAIANRWSRDCAKLQSDKAAIWFEADSDTEAVDAVNAMHAALDALRSGKIEAKGCDYGLDEGETCSQAILRVGRLDKIGSIGHDCQQAAGQSCVELFLNDAKSMALTIVFSLKNNSPTPEDIIEVTAGVYVTVT